MSEPTIRDVLEALIGFREAVELRFDSNDRRFDRIEEHLAAHDRRFDDIDRGLESQDRRLELHDRRLELIDGRLVSLETKLHEGFKTVNHRLGKLEAQRH